MNSHGAAAAQLLDDPGLVQSVLKDYRTSGLSEAEQVLFAFLQKVNGCSYQIRREDVDQVRGAGWSEEALYDAITVCALFNFYNRWVDSTGVHVMSSAAHAISGKRLAEHGYILE